MSNEDIPLLERVASYYSQLSTVAADLNTVSDELGNLCTSPQGASLLIKL